MRVYSCKDCSAKYLLVCGKCGGIQFMEESRNMAPSSHEDLTVREFHRNENITDSNLCTQPNLTFDRQRLLNSTDFECHRNKECDVSDVRSQRIIVLDDKQPLDNITKNETAFKGISAEIENNNRDQTPISHPTVIVCPRNKDAKVSHFRSHHIPSEKGKLWRPFSENRTSTNASSQRFPNACCETQTSRAKDNDERLHSNFDYVADSTNSSRVNPERVMYFHDQPTNTELNKQSSTEMMLGKEITAESSRIESQDGENDFSGWSPCRSRLPPSVPENFNVNDIVKHTQKKATKCSRQPIRKRGSPSTENFSLQQRAHSSKKATKMGCVQNPPIALEPVAERSTSMKRKPRYECEKCTRKFKNEKLFTLHMEKHGKGNLFKCNVCPKEYFHKCRLRRHSVFHTDERPFKCNYCKFATRVRNNLIKHIRRRHKSSLSIREMVCNECLLQFRQESKLSADDPNTFKCELCPAGFHCDHKLNQHYNSAHKGEKRFICDVCGHAFKTRINLKMHRNSVHKK